MEPITAIAGTGGIGNRLPGLITRHGAHHVALDVLPDAEARALLADRLGATRVAADPRAVDRLIALCGGLPLALGMIAAHAHTRPHISLAVLADELEDLDDDDPTTSFASVLSWSVRALRWFDAEHRAVVAAQQKPRNTTGTRRRGTSRGHWRDLPPPPRTRPRPAGTPR